MKMFWDFLYLSFDGKHEKFSISGLKGFSIKNIFIVPTCVPTKLMEHCKIVDIFMNNCKENPQ